MLLTAPLNKDLTERLPTLPETAPPRARDLAAEGMAALQKGRYQEALEKFQTLDTFKEVEGAHYLSKLGMHLVWSKQREYSKALNVLKEALGLGDDRLVLLWIGVTLHQMERFEEALDVFDKVKDKWPNDPDVWVYRMAPLTSLGRGQAALESAERAFPLRHKSFDHGQTMYISAGLVSVASGLSALERLSTEDLKSSTTAFITWQERAREDSQVTAFKKAVSQFKGHLTREQKEVLSDFFMNVRLTCIKDPFERWDAIAEEINKVWPKDLDAVEAIRRQRR